jgi:hypothetical protein
MACPNLPRPKKAKRVKSMLFIFFDIKGIVHKEFVLAGQTVNSAYYCHILRRLCEDVLRLHPELWSQKNWLLHNNTLSHTSFFTKEFLIKKHDCHPSPPCSSLFPRLKIKLKNRNFDTNEVIGGRIAGSGEHPQRTQLPECI